MADSMQGTLQASAAKRTEQPRFSQDQLDAFISAHERFVTGKPNGHRAILRFLQAPGCDFSRRLLSDADLTGANLRNTKMADVNLERASLFCADLLKADVRRANLKRADLRGASLKHADLSGAMMDGIDMRRAVLVRADFEGGHRLAGGSAAFAHGEDSMAFMVDLSNASLKGAKFGDAKLRNVNFDGANLNGADFKGADVAGSSFKGAVLTGVTINQLNVDSKALEGSVRDPSAAAAAAAPDLLARMQRCRDWIRSGGKDGAPAIFDGEDLRALGPVFAGAQLTAMSARKACGVGVDFQGARLQGACFDGADLRDADFSEADLRGATFRAANLFHARFAGANMSPLPLAKGGTRAVDLSDARILPESLVSAILQ